jgi:hypothetical protein
MRTVATAPPTQPIITAQGVSESWFSWPCSGDGESVAPGAPVVGFTIVDGGWAPDVDEGSEVDWILENERERVVDPGAREVVAKLGAAAAARAGSNRAAIC